MEENRPSIHEKIVMAAVIGMFLFMFCKILFF